MRCRPLALLLTALALAAAAPAVPAAAGEDVPVFPGVVRRELTVRLADGGPAVAHVLDVDAADPGLELRPILARDRVGGLETVPAIAGRHLDDGVVAGVNGGFWLNNPVGDPNGYLAVDGALISESQTQGAGPRGTFAVTEAGALLFDRLATDLTLEAAGATLDVTGLNRGYSAAPPYPDGAAPVLAYTPAFGDEVTVAPIAPGLPVRALVVAGLTPPTGGADEGVVTAVAAAGTIEIPADGAVVVAHGAAAERLAGAGEGTAVTISTEAVPLDGDPAAWAGVDAGLAAGPLIVLGGRRTDPSGWEAEGFAPQVHSLVRHPRTAVARTGDGHLLLVAVDGRQPGLSVGMTIAELADLLIELGAVDALSLDGGGSSQLVVDGLLRNRACCDANLRPVANGLFVRHRYDFAAARRLGGSGRAGTAAAVAAEAFPDGAPEAVLASGAGFPDALAGGPLAADLGGPLLLTTRDELPEATVAALDELDPETVTVLGGVEAVGEGVVAELETRGHAVRRLAGANRIATAAAIARDLETSTARAFLASARDFPDALTAAAPAGLMGAPVLLTERDTLSADTRRALRGRDQVVLAGGAAAVGERVAGELRDLGLDVVRLGGDDRFGTSRAINEWAGTQLDCPETATAAPETATTAACLDETGLVVARGDVFADALAGGPLAAARRQLLAIVPSPDVFGSADVRAFLRAREAALTEVTLLGGVAALSSYQHWQLDQLAR